MDQYHAIHAGDRVVITHGEAAKLHRGKVWTVATGPEPCPCCGKLSVRLKGYDGISSGSIILHGSGMTITRRDINNIPLSRPRGRDALMQLPQGTGRKPGEMQSGD